MSEKIPHVLMILDGIGHRQDSQDNAVAHAHTPVLDKLFATRPFGLISTSGLDVGLPEGQFGNSEVGHMNLGAGRILFQDSTRISKAIDDGDFFDNAQLLQAIQKTKDNEGALQILGLVSDGGVHAHINHIIAMVKMALQQGAQVYIHAFLDGRDTPPKSAITYMQTLQNALDELNAQYQTEAKIASVIGRFFAMDRDKRWERVQQAYDLLTTAKAVRHAQTATEAVQLAYDNQESDEFIEPTIIDDNGIICDNDGVIFMNFRADRARQLSQAFIQPDFTGFQRHFKPALSAFVTLTKYSDELSKNPKTSVAYTTNSLHNTLGEYLQNQQKTQLRIAETEKYAHVTFFFSGGQERLYKGETRILIPSPNVKTYDLRPQMSAHEITDKLCDAIESGEFDVLIVNYANGDMVGHTGNFDAAVQAVQAVDNCIGRVLDKVLEKNGHMLITADHGNCEQMQDYISGQAHTQHTLEPVPLIYIGDKSVQIRSGGKLCDIAPTLLHLMGLDKPSEMTGENLLINS